MSCYICSTSYQWNGSRKKIKDSKLGSLYNNRKNKTPLKERKPLSSPPKRAPYHLVNLRHSGHHPLPMAEEILNFVCNLRIDDEEDKVLNLDSINPNPENKVSLFLLGCLLTERSFIVEAFKITITTVWASTHGLIIRVL